MAKLAPNIKGPSVSAAQYSKTFCGKARWLETRQMCPKVRSIVTIKAKDVTSTATKPTAPSRLALRENCVSEPSTWRAMLSGTRLCTSHCCNWSCTLANTGNAVKMAKPMVNKGTRANTVVKVSELAVMPKRASRKRSRNK